MSMEDLIDGGDLKALEVLEVDEIVGTLNRPIVDPNAETVVMPVEHIQGLSATLAEMAELEIEYHAA